ncbi:MAG: amino acid kinase family protein [Promethearchaeota archaeon]|jgi:aspartokinase-like uncharacterized kinase
MKLKTAIFKIGGSLLEDFEDLNSIITQFKRLNNEGLVERVIIIPGGGSLANFIRKVYSELKFTEEVAHWMGIISMNYNGIEIGKKFSELKVIEEFDKLQECGKKFILFLPYRFLKNTDTLPHSWDVTSDSITLFLANKLRLINCFLIKDVDGIFDIKNRLIKEISTSEFVKIKSTGKLFNLGIATDDLKRQTKPIDPYSITLINKYRITCIILNGRSKTSRVADFFDNTKPENEKVYTKIKW